MKKLNKILAAISTAALTFCVWGTQTQAEVITNENGVPILINAKTNEEFFGDLQQVLNHIGSRLLVDEGYEMLKAHELFLKENELTRETEGNIVYSKYTDMQYNHALKLGGIYFGMSTGYLYNLLLKSTIGNRKIQNVYILILIRQGEPHNDPDIIFQLDDVYYTPCLRWFLWSNWMRRNELTPTPMTVRESFEKGPDFADSEIRISFMAIAPTSIKGGYATPLVYRKTEFLNHTETIIPKLISIAGRRIKDKRPVAVFKSHYNPITNYDEFLEDYNKPQQ